MFFKRPQADSKKFPYRHWLSALLLCCLAVLLPAPGALAQAPESAMTSGQAIPAELPDDIYIKTPTRSFNSRFYYALHQGRIWIKPNRLAGAADQPWQRMSCDGLPCEPGNKDFPVPTAIAEISADADELTVLDDKGRFYFRTMAGPGWMSKTEWTHLAGFPKSEMSLPARLGKRRAWTMGRRHFDVLWHEDADGNEHHVGVMGTSSVYVLHEQGHEIWYTDNGLPADLSHVACGPERSTTILENLQASAATLFAIDASGQTYTIMDDFDLNGGTSMYISYSYSPQKKYDKPLGKDYASHLKPWRLPLEDWRKQAPIPLTGKARLSKDITILQTGQGNAARELRVAGRDSAGRSGYYHKAIFAPSWSFSPVALAIAPERWLDPGEPPLTPVLPQDIDYFGALTLGPEATYMAEIKDLNLHCSPATLRLILPDGPVDLTLHTVDAWVQVKRQDPGRDGSMQLMLGTLEIPDSLREKLPPVLKDLDRNPFRLHIGATTDQVMIFHLDGRLQGILPRIKPLLPSVKTYNYRYTLPPGSYASARLRSQGLAPTRNLDPSLVRIDLDKVPAAELEQLTRDSRELLGQLRQEADAILGAKMEAWGTAMFATTLRGAYAATGMCWWAPNGQAFCRTAQSLVGSYYRLEDDLNQRTLSRYTQLLSQVRFRLERYEAQLRKVKGR